MPDAAAPDSATRTTPRAADQIPGRRKQNARTTSRPSVLHLVRHGESTWNLAGRIQGQSLEAGGLTAAGRAQAQLTANLLAERPRPAAIIASDLIRARETAEIIAAHLGLPLEFDPALREQQLGVLEGRRLDLPFGDDPTAQDAVDRLWREPFLRPDGGESIVDMYDRVHRAFRRHAEARPGVEIVLVTHGGPVRMASTPERPTPEVEVPRIGVDNASVTTITVG
jgi:probable phosphoglycerate mutase